MAVDMRPLAQPMTRGQRVLNACKALCKLFMYIPMVLVLLLVGCDVYNFDFVWAPMMMGKSPFYCVFMSVLFNVTTSLLLVSYLRCVFTSTAQRVLLNACVTCAAPSSSYSTPIALSNLSRTIRPRLTGMHTTQH